MLNVFLIFPFGAEVKSSIYHLSYPFVLLYGKLITGEASDLLQEYRPRRNIKMKWENF